MAEIKVTNAFVEDVITDRDGVAFVIRTSEPHRRKNEQGEWETTARTFRSVRTSRDSGVNLPNFTKGDRISFEGTEKTEKRERDGRTFYDLICWATRIDLQGGGASQQTEQPAEQWATPDTAWTDTDTPF